MPYKGGHWRQIVVDGKKYRWRGRTHVVIQDWETGIRVASALVTEVKGITWDAWERGQHDGNPDGMLRPGDVVEFLRKKLVTT
jgi:hypothetical protein